MSVQLVDGRAKHAGDRTVARGGPRHLRPRDARLQDLRRHGVDFNILCTVNAANEKPRARGLSLPARRTGGDLDAVHPDRGARPQSRRQIANRGLSAQAGSKRLLIRRRATWSRNARLAATIRPLTRGHLEEWVRRDVAGCTSSCFDVTLEAYFGRHCCASTRRDVRLRPPLRINGDLYSAITSVEPKYLWATSISAHAEAGGVTRAAQVRDDKRDSLTEHAGAARFGHRATRCPKESVRALGDGEAGQNYLCRGSSCSSRTRDR